MSDAQAAVAIAQQRIEACQQQVDAAQIEVKQVVHFAGSHCRFCFLVIVMRCCAQHSGFFGSKSKKAAAIAALQAAQGALQVAPIALRLAQPLLAKVIRRAFHVRLPCFHALAFDWRQAEGEYCAVITTISVPDRKGNSGLVISPDGALMAVSNSGTHKVAVYSLPDGALQAEFGGKGIGPGQFDHPLKLCFSLRSGNLLIADSRNKRVQVRVVSCAVCSLSSILQHHRN